MTVQINTGNNIKATKEFTEPLTELITGDLSRFGEQITRIEVHLSDENGDKESPNDKRCVMEARLEGRQPIAVTNEGNTHEGAVIGALEKLRSTLETITGKMKNHSGPAFKNHSNLGFIE